MLLLQLLSSMSKPPFEEIRMMNFAKKSAAFSVVTWTVCCFGSVAHAANTIDPNSTGATDVVQDPDGTPVTLTNPLSDPLDLGTDDLAVGNTAAGDLLIDNASSVVSGISYVGYDPGSVGAVTVDGTSSTWSTSGLFVGYFGDATLDVVNGAAVSGTRDIGRESGATGVVTVDGVGSTLSGNINVGVRGNGELNILDGGFVSSTGGIIGFANGSSGAVLVEGPGSTWNGNGGLLDVGFTTGGQGTLAIRAGGTVSSGTGSIAFLGGQGDVEVQGAGSSWSIDSDAAGLLIGNNGTLSILDGGSVTSPEGPAAGFSGGFVFGGTVSVDGVGSQWINSGNLSTLGTGSFDQPNVTVTGGGVISNASAFLSLDSINHLDDTHIVVDGLGSTWTNTDSLFLGGSDTAAGGTATVDITSNGTVNVTNTTKLWAGGILNLDGGTLSTGSFDNSEGGFFNFSDGELIVVGGAFDHGASNLLLNGSTSTDNPTLTLNGAAPTSAPGVNVGYDEKGTLNLRSGSSLTSNSGYVGREAGSDGAVTVEDSGSSWTISGPLFVGANGDGSFLISSGGSVSNTTGILGSESGATATAIVEGPGSTWTNSGSLRVGVGGAATLEILDGGTVSNTTGLVEGTVTVDGAGSTWTNGALRIGVGTDGSMIISNGGSVTSGRGDIGFGFSGEANGNVTVDGAGSTWTSSNAISVHSGQGSLSILGGGVVTSLAGSASGTVIVSGIDSAWNNSQNLSINGSLDIMNGGQATATDGSIGGQLTVGDVGSTWMSDELYVGGTATFILSDGNLALQSGGLVDVSNLVEIYGAGTVELSGGRLVAATVDHSHGGTFSFTGGELAVGTFNGLLQQDGGTLAPGTSSGTTTVNGDYTMNAGTLEIEIFDGASGSPVAGVDFDQLVADTVNLADTLDLVIDAGYAPTLGDMFPIVTATGGVSGMFSSVNNVYLSGGFTFDVIYNANDVTLEVIPALLGDFDLDGDVDGPDLTDANVGWEARFGSGLSGGDFLDWQRQFNGNFSPPLAASYPVPEPSSAVLFIGLAAIYGEMRIRKRLQWFAFC